MDPSEPAERAFPFPDGLNGSLDADLEQARRTLSEQHQRLMLAARVGGLGVWDYDIASDRITCDRQWHQIVGLDSGTPITSVEAFRQIIHPDDRERATEVENTARLLLADRKDYGIEFRIIRPDGEIRWVRSSACLFDDAQGRPVRAVGYVVDITDSHLAADQLKASNQRLQEENRDLQRQALIDPLTGIANRRRLDQELARACKHAARSGQSLTVAIIDVDFFKGYNDHYGHGQGDVALATVAEAVASAAWRPYDLAARYGGEEFVILLPDAPDPVAIFDRIFANVAARALPHATSPISPTLTISCGSTTTDHPTLLAPQMLLDACDRALYRAKQQGRNRVCIEDIKRTASLPRHPGAGDAGREAKRPD